MQGANENLDRRIWLVYTGIIMNSLMTLREVAAYLSMGVDAIYKMAQQGRIPALRAGSLWRFRKSEIDQWLEKNKNNG